MAKAATTDDTSLPRGGMWERQHLYGGLRLQQEFPAGEAFILWGMEVIGEVPMDDGTATKTELDVSRIAQPDEKFKVNTLSSAIAAMVPDATPDDFPVEAYWHEVSTSRNLNDAVVLTAIRRWIDPATL